MPTHVIYAIFRRLELSAGLVGERARRVRSISVRFRPLDQALAFPKASEMSCLGDTFTVRVPARNLDGAYALAYAFVVNETSGVAWRYLGMGADLCQRPYYVVRPAGP